MDLALTEARARNADVIIANDPDADRCAVGIRTAEDYRMLTGDEVGALLAWWIVERGRRDGKPVRGVYAESIVSCTLLERMDRLWRRSWAQYAAAAARGVLLDEVAAGLWVLLLARLRRARTGATHQNTPDDACHPQH
jgi:hypothetical protein